MSFYALDSLSKGTAVQRSASQCLSDLRIMQSLEAYTPVVCGTIPLRIDIAGSDIDIICEADDFVKLEQLLRKQYAALSAFACCHRLIRGTPSLVTNLRHQNFEVEIFAQAVPVRQQYAFRHMCIEKRILDLAELAFRQEIIQLKTEGMKTEPAFAHLLKLSGDPYDSLLILENHSDAEIRALL